MQGQGLAPFTRIPSALVAQRGALFPWVPVCLGSGIGGYFLWPVEPSLALQAAIALVAVAMVGAGLRAGPALSPLFWALALLAMGNVLAGARAHLIAAPVLLHRYYGPVEGRVIAIDRSGSDAMRLTLDRVILYDTAPADTPEKVRVSLHGDQRWHRPFPGETVILTAHLSPPSGSAEPGGFDFRRHAWFQRVGAVGYTRTPVLLLEPRRSDLPIAAARLAMSERVRAALPGETGAFAAALMTGDRSAIGQDVLLALRRANLAHLLAISGLHMGLVAGFVFAAIRVALTLVPRIGLRVPAKKIAAVGALAVAAGYLVLSGGNVATERAFVMVAVFLAAVMFDRRPLSMRAVAVAAIVVLLLRPESLLGPGFQMSFAATTALVAVFGVLRDSGRLRGRGVMQTIIALCLSSAVAGAATAPFAAAHFNQIPVLGLPANLLSVPLMGLLVMPAAVLAALLMPIGAEAPVLWGMGLGLDWILAVARFASDRDGAVRMVVSPQGYVLPRVALGALFVVLWRGRLKWAGLAPVALALLLWGRTDRPDLLIAENGALVGVMTSEGRALSRDRGSGFVAGIWLENDGDSADQAGAALRWPDEDSRLLVLSGKRAAQSASCRKGDWLISNTSIDKTLPCRLYDPETLRRTGAVAVYFTDAGPRIETARQLAGDRPWNMPADQ